MKDRPSAQRPSVAKQDSLTLTLNPGVKIIFLGLQKTYKNRL